MATAISKEKFCTIISEVLDKSKDVVVDTQEETLDYDAVELTCMLKAIGFRLQSLEFDGARQEDTNDIEVEIRCRRSGILSKLGMKSKKCTCPSRKSTNNNSFWEVQGTGPATPISNAKAIVQDTSCNLMPDISRKTGSVAKTILTILLQHYQEDFQPKENKQKTLDVKQVIERLNVKRQSMDKSSDESIKDYVSCVDNADNNKTCSIDKNSEDSLKNLASPADGIISDQNAHCSTPLSSINVTPVPSYDGPILNVVPKVILANSSNENTTEIHVLELKNPPEELLTDNKTSTNPPVTVEMEILPATPTDAHMSFDKLNTDNERDICVIQSITEARKQLDSALLLLKCNVTRDISHSSLLTVTPQSLKPMLRSSPSSPAKRNSSVMTAANRRQSTGALDSNRRHSTGPSLVGKILLSPSKLKGTAQTGDSKRKIFKTPVASRFLKPDTPKPTLDASKLVNEKSLNKMIFKRSSTGTNLKTVNGGVTKPQTIRSASKLVTPNPVKK